MKALDVQNLSKQYPGELSPKKAINNISFSVQFGEILFILGPNGAGKTTLVKAILDLVEVDTGQISIMGQLIQPKVNSSLFQKLTNIFNNHNRLGLAHVGSVLEDSRNSDWAMTVEENLRYFGAYQGMKTKTAVDDVIDFLSLNELRHKTVAKLSRGQKQMVALAIALVHDPEILILDEPTLGLDVENARKLENVIVDLAQQQKKAVIITTHVMELAQRIATDVMVINQGEILTLLPKEELLKKYDLQRKKIELRVAGHMGDTTIRAMQESGIQVYENGNKTVLLLEDEKQDAEVYQMLTSNGYQVDSLERRHATLEEIFLSLIKNGNIN